MDIDPRIRKLRSILFAQIDWYQKNKENEDLVYDELWEEFMDLPKGAFVEIIETILEKDSYRD